MGRVGGGNVLNTDGWRGGGSSRPPSAEGFGLRAPVRVEEAGKFGPERRGDLNFRWRLDGRSTILDTSGVDINDFVHF